MAMMMTVMVMTMADVDVVGSVGWLGARVTGRILSPLRRPLSSLTHQPHSPCVALGRSTSALDTKAVMEACTAVQKKHTAHGRHARDLRRREGQGPRLRCESPLPPLFPQPPCFCVN